MFIYIAPYRTKSVSASDIQYQKSQFIVFLSFSNKCNICNNQKVYKRISRLYSWEFIHQNIQNRPTRDAKCRFNLVFVCMCVCLCLFVSAGGKGPAGRERLWTNLQNHTQRSQQVWGEKGGKMNVNLIMWGASCNPQYIKKWEYIPDFHPLFLTTERESERL